ncbi:MAG: TonB-dependent receptor family protein [Bacteroidota bacterium]|nr:TonB-dependent receptor family protein [Bacteroidota bacterium]
MKKNLFFFFILATTLLHAQTTLRGKVTDSSFHRLRSATVQLHRDSGNVTLNQTITDSAGAFSFNNIYPGKYIITVSFVGYGTSSNLIAAGTDSVTTLSTIVLTKATGTLAGVTVIATEPAVTQKADTIQYSANQYKVNPDATSEDLIKKMPGITVGSDGTVTAHGDQVKKVLIDGKEYFGDDPTAALRNLPADVIDKIQVFDKLSDQAQFTGFDDGNSQRTINIVTKGGLRNSQFGKVYAGFGTDGRYSAGGNINFFNGDRRIGIIGLSNNINQQNFSQQDILGVLSSGSNNSGRGGGGGGRGGGGGTNNFVTGTANGINSTNSLGVNFSDVWGKKLTVTGSYFFNNSENTTAQKTNRQNLISEDSNLLYKENLNSSNNNYNNRINMRMEYKLDSADQFIFTPVLSFQNNRANSLTAATNTLENGKLLSDILNGTNTTTTGYNFSANLLYRHAFHKRGRSISFGVTPGLNDNTGTTYQNIFNSDSLTNNGTDSTQLLRDINSHTKSVSGYVGYTEPVGKKAMIQWNYNPSYQYSTAKQLTNHYDDALGKYNLLDTSLSNLFNNIIVRHNTGLSYRIGDRFNNFMVGLNYQYTDMKSDRTYPEALTIHKTFNNLLPNLMFNKKLSAKANLRLFYRAATQTPSVTQLQNVYNNNNPLFVTTGNPDLKQAYNNTLALRYTYTNTEKSSSFFFNTYIQQSNNYITNATFTARRDSLLTKSVILASGSQLSKPVNLNGYWNYRSLATYTFPLKFIKTNFSINSGFNYTIQPGLIYNSLNLSKNYGYTGGVNFASNISQYIDFNISYNAGYNKVINSLQPQNNVTYFSGNAAASINLLSKSGWVLHTDLANQIYTGLSSGFNQNYTLWNASAGKKFLKNQRGDLRLSVFDILKQNQSITRTTTASYIQDVQTNVLQRYFMLLFTYKINNVRSSKQPTRATPQAPFRERNYRNESGQPRD